MGNIKTLRVCISKELPTASNRSSDFIYFTYDELIVYLGQQKYADPYAIVEKLPDNPSREILYFCLDDGKVKVIDDREVIQLAKIESDDQLELLKQAGTIFFYNARTRYLDKQTRTISLPYQNGTYELTVAIANELKINENTVIKYNTDTNQFEISGNIEDYGIIPTHGYEGRNTDTTETHVTEGKITTDVKVSKAYDNILKKVSDGLFVSGADKVTREEFEGLRTNYQDYKATLEYYLKTIQASTATGQELVNRDSINAKIKKALEDAYPDIDKAIANYDEILDEINRIDQESKEYSRSQTATAKNEILDVANNPWEIIGNPKSEDVTTAGIGELKELKEDFTIPGWHNPEEVLLQKDTQIQLLQNDITSLQSQVDTLTNMTNSLEDNINKLESENNSLKLENDTLKKKLSDAQLGEEKTNIITSTAIAAFLESSV